jgi:hypothetical protein
VVLNTNKTEHHNINVLLLIVVLNTNKNNHHSIIDLLLSYTVVVSFIGV